MPRVHIVPGDSGAGSLRQALDPSAGDIVVALSDALSCGPAPVSTTIAAWEHCRQSFWSQVYDEDLGLPIGSQTVGLLREAEAVTVWLGTGLGDQLALPWFCWFMALAEVPSGRLQVVQFPAGFAAGHQTPSLGMLSPSLIQSHPPAQHLRAEDVNLLNRAWSAITDPEPETLSSLLTAMVLPPTLGLALTRVASRYPDQRTGMSHWDYCLLSNARLHAPSALYTVAHTLSGDGWDTDPVGDGWLFWRLKRLADPSLGTPLVALHGDLRALRETTVEVTSAGYAVLNNSASALDVRPIDDWVLGVHLDARRGGAWVASSSSLNEPAALLPNNGLQLTWRSLRSHHAAET